MVNTEQEVLLFEDVTVRFEDNIALEEVSFSVKAGETRVILGAAGSGKTVLLKTALGLVRPASGKVVLFGEDISTEPEEDMFDVRGQVGMLFQEGALFDSQTVEENVAYPLLNRQIAVEKPTPARIKEIEERVREALRFVELEHTIEKFPSELSGGMRRRVGIARAAVTAPPLLLYDSPTAGLDPITANNIMAFVAKERDANNTTTMIVTHRYQDGHLMANFRYNPEKKALEPVNGGGPGTRTTFMVLREGRLVFEGAQEELAAAQDPYLRKFGRR